MKYIYIYEPLMDEKGHFKRYISHIESLFEKSFKVIIIKNKEKINIQSKIIEAKGNLNKLLLSILLFKVYIRNLFKYRNEIILITSHGNPIFWIIAILFLKNYIICIISCHHFESKNKKWLFNLFIAKSLAVIFTNKIHRDKYFKDGYVVRDRIHGGVDLDSKTIDYSQIKVLGHISENRNPLGFIKRYSGKSKIVVKGKVVDEAIALEITEHTNAILVNKYLSDEDYINEIVNSLIYIPVEKKYSDYLISGVFYDVIEKGGIPVIHNHELYAEYFEAGIAICSEKNDYKNFNIKLENYAEISNKYNNETESSIKSIVHLINKYCIN
ncbi:hypothetical protein [Polynucleobacter sp. AP-Reno-20A-A9]|uniref:hypothetical protein n=1 Tax=Polynucleobacter sp. AP-Reno-20A-A9 TaxID=2576925 RepID=UPI001C0E444D|nr:hypothetical protein [Polynucleobacter sp. AP-Reno-20A-A9]MBU3629317.1 hypothetical protein [Polynucleobacter sp. AP-Reno-20A-A9]